jgi:hypothetical protein
MKRRNKGHKNKQQYYLSMNRFFHALNRFNKPIYLSSLFISLHLVYNHRIRIISLITNITGLYKKPQEKIKNIFTESEEYIDGKTTMFMKKYENIDENNANIEKSFYNKSLFSDAIKDEDNELELRWRRRLLIETTPRGNIYMYYDVYKQGFAYYTDSSSIPYSILNAAAMKYCSVFKCLDLFVDQTITPIKTPSPLIQIHHIDEKKKKQKEIMKSGPYAQFKSINTIDTKKVNKGKDTSKKEEEDLITNKFINMGKLYNMNMLSNQPKKIKTNFHSPMMDNLKGEMQLQGEVMNYKDYKKSLDIQISQLV